MLELPFVSNRQARIVTPLCARPAQNCVIKGNRDLLRHLPSHKSLFQAPENRGLPVGNLTSQFFANVYLNELDQYVKHILKCKYYIRYCDDFVLLHESSEKLAGLRARIETFVNERLGLELNAKYHNILPVSNGIDFLGFIVRPGYTLVRRRVVNNLSESGFENGPLIFQYDYELLEKLLSVLASYFGHMKWANSFRLRQALVRRYAFLKEFFYFDERNGLAPLFRYRTHFPSVKHAYRYYAAIFKGATVFFQVGCFNEFYGPLGKDVRESLGLKPMKENTRGALYGFPMRLEGDYAGKLLQKGISVVIVRETDRYIGRVKERLPKAGFHPSTGSG